MDFQNAVKPLVEFTEQSKRVLNITHKPHEQEYRQMSLTTGIGLALIGLIGFIISMLAHYARFL